MTRISTVFFLNVTANFVLHPFHEALGSVSCDNQKLDTSGNVPAAAHPGAPD